MNPRLLPEQRTAIIQQATQLAAALNLASGDSPDLTQAVREQLMARMRGLSLLLWSDGHGEEGRH
jgi:hypothetical protein